MFWVGWWFTPSSEPQQHSLKDIKNKTQSTVQLTSARTRLCSWFRFDRQKMVLNSRLMDFEIKNRAHNSISPDRYGKLNHETDYELMWSKWTKTAEHGEGDEGGAASWNMGNARWRFPHIRLLSRDPLPIACVRGFVETIFTMMTMWQGKNQGSGRKDRHRGWWSIPSCSSSDWQHR